MCLYSTNVNGSTVMCVVALGAPNPQSSTSHGQPQAGSPSTPAGPVGGIRRGRGWREWRRGDPTLLNGLWKSKTPLGMYTNRKWTVFANSPYTQCSLSWNWESSQLTKITLQTKLKYRKFSEVTFFDPEVLAHVWKDIKLHLGVFWTVRTKYSKLICKNKNIVNLI